MAEQSTSQRDKQVVEKILSNAGTQSSCCILWGKNGSHRLVADLSRGYDFKSTTYLLRVAFWRKKSWNNEPVLFKA